MKLYGRRAATSEDDDLVILEEVSVVAEPEDLLRLAGFLADCARMLKQKETSWDHRHFLDTFMSEGKNLPDVIVVKEGKLME